MAASNANLNANMTMKAVGKIVSVFSRKAEMMSSFSGDETARIKQLFIKNATLAVIGEGTKKTRVLKRETFYSLMHSMFGLSHMQTLDGLFRAFDVKSSSYVENDEWLLGLSIMTRGNFKERIDFVWRVYNINEDDRLSRGEMFMFLKDAIIGPKNEEDLVDAINDVIEMLHRKLDVTYDGIIDKADFITAVSQQPALLECLGQVFPSVQKLKVFETAIGNETKIEL